MHSRAAASRRRWETSSARWSFALSIIASVRRFSRLAGMSHSPVSTKTALESLPPEAAGALRAFLDYLQAECGLSLNTRRAYRRDLAAFLGHLAAPIARRLERLTAGDIESFLRHSKAGGHSVATVARQLAAIRTFCRFLVIHHISKRDVSEVILAPKKWNRLPEVLRPADVDMLLTCPSAGTDR
jgi:site-specific recombinase XerD